MAAPQKSVASPAGDDEAAGAGSPLRMSLGCPQCGVKGWIKWTSLNHGIHCPKCKCEFLVGRTGQLHATRDLPQTRFTCPRCGKSGSIPSTLVVQKAECVDCKLPLVQGPDQRLHGVKEAAELRAAQSRLAKPTYAQWLQQNLRTDDGRVRRTSAAIAVGLLLALAMGVTLLVRGLLDNSVETQAARFTACCLAGDWKNAVKYVGDDDVQIAEFERWRMRHFTSIIKKFRPAGDRVDLDFTSLDGTLGVRRLQVAMSSPFLGTRVVEQTWYEQDGAWRFDALATLNAQDSIATRPAKPTAPRSAPPTR